MILTPTGLPDTPTPVGRFRIWIKLRYDDMSGPGYYLEDVAYVMYSYWGHGFHGVWWHASFGHPMSHGCINLPSDAAEWPSNCVNVGTLVNVYDWLTRLAGFWHRRRVGMKLVERLGSRHLMQGG